LSEAEKKHKDKASVWDQKNNATLSYEYLSANDFESSRYSFSTKSPIGKIDDYMLSVNLKTGYINTSSDSYFPDNLYEAGATLEARDKKRHIRLSANSNSDKPFDSMHEVILGLNGTYKVKLTEASLLHIGLNYSTHRQYLENIPLPVLMYEYKSKDLYARMGIPFIFLKWSLNEKASLDLSVFPIINGKFTLSYKVSGTFTVAAEGKTGKKTYLMSERDDKDEQLSLESKKIGIRISKSFMKNLSLFGYIGYSFDGSYYRGKKYFDKDDEVDISDSLIMSTGMRVSF
jgi:hypothetical protein